METNKKIKLLILYLSGWSKVNNENYPEDEVIHRKWGYRSFKDAWKLQFKNNKTKKIKFLFSGLIKKK